MHNTFSNDWFSLFLLPVPAEQTDEEVAFLVRNLPQPQTCSVLDVCCGVGRHAVRLRAHGYRVLGIDTNMAVLHEAGRAAVEGLSYRLQDMRHIADLPGRFDAVVCLWQSFGYFDNDTNRSVLNQMAQKLEPGGRLILDLYNRRFFERQQGERNFFREGVFVTEKKRMSGDRLRVELAYEPGGGVDCFDWQLYTPEELVDELERLGLRCLLACTNFDERQTPSAESPRMQLVFEKPAGLST